MGSPDDSVPYYKDYEVFVQNSFYRLIQNLQINAIRGVITSACFLLVFIVIGLVKKYRCEIRIVQPLSLTTY